MTWSSRIIETLRELKRTGVSFDDAWAVAVSKHPPRLRDEGYRDTLFVLDGDDGELSTVEWLHAVAGDAWHDRRPALRYLTEAMGLVTDTMDDSAPARMMHAHGQVVAGPSRHVA